MRRRFRSSNAAMLRKIVRWLTPSLQLGGRFEREEVEIFEIGLHRFETGLGGLLRVQAQQEPASEPPGRDVPRIGRERGHVTLLDELLPQAAAQAVRQR